MPQFDTIIKNGTIVDGTRVPRYRADIGIKNGKIAKIGRLNANDATKVVDANGLIVAPGFIDMPKVVNGESDLLVQLFGEKGRHTRAAIGVASLSNDAPVENEVTVQVKD